MSVLRWSRIRVEDFGRMIRAMATRAAGGLALAAVVTVFGCASNEPPALPSEIDAAVYQGGTIQIGDRVKVTFPGAPNLNFAQTVRVDGKLDLAQAGEIEVTGKTAVQLEEELLKIFDPDLIVKELNVEVESALFPVFVGGAMTRPRKIMVNRSVTVMEAIVEAGGFDMARANMRKVRVIRQENGKQRTFIIDLTKALEQAESEPFHLRPADVIFIPEKLIYF